MMMPRGGEIPISYAPDAENGFRLGLMQEFGLDVSDAEDVRLDDIIHIDAEAFDARELAMERYYDHMLAVTALKSIFDTKPEFEQ